jgi:ABC-type nitrate/sulfonate/bicarbonate transport system permease component
MTEKRVRSVATPYNIRQPLDSITTNILRVAGILTVIAVYSIICYWKHLPAPIGNPTDSTIPTLTQFIEGIKAIVERRHNGSCWLVDDLKVTFGRLFKGMLISSMVSIVLGILMGCYRAVDAFFGLIISAMAKEPATAMLAAFFILLGTREPLYLGVVVFGTMPWLTQTIADAARNDVHRNAINKMISFNATPCEQIYDGVFKQILPRIIDSVRIATSAALIGLLAAEMQVGNVGFGYRMQINSRRLDMSIVYEYLIILVLIGYVIDYVFINFRKVWCPWFGEQQESKPKSHFSWLIPSHPIAKVATLILILVYGAFR